MAWNNQSVIREFILQGLSSAWELQIFYFLFFSIVYAATVLGNLLILLTIVSEPRLHSPMYFLLGNLSFIDMSLASFATPKMIADFLSEHKAISFEGYTYILGVFMISTSGMIALVCFILLVISYTVILVTVRQHSSGGSSKALSTCSAHFTVVALFFGPCIFIYVWPFTNFPIEKVLSVFYTIFTPLLNPVIYTLRTKDVKDSMRKLSSRVFKSRKTDHTP
uniref:G-protein coupled receptors family 1 profile domain-containing protein n=1 Tax=Sus scrofa TaxID=9823 RepID=A0A4X1V4H2_PIG